MVPEDSVAKVQSTWSQLSRFSGPRAPGTLVPPPPHVALLQAGRRSLHRPSLPMCSHPGLASNRERETEPRIPQLVALRGKGGTCLVALEDHLVISSI